MKVSLRGQTEKTLCDVLFDILVECREQLSWRRPSIYIESAEKVRVRRFIYRTNSRYFKAAAALEDHLHIICISIIDLKKTEIIKKGTLISWRLIQTREFVMCACSNATLFFLERERERQRGCCSHLSKTKKTHMLQASEANAVPYQYFISSFLI